MARSDLVASPEQVIENILRYQVALDDEERGAKLRDLMSHVHAWYAVRPDGEEWLFAPSKFVGYVDNTAAAYFLERGSRDGRKTETILQQWFHPIEPGTRQADTLGQALRDFLWSHGHSGPRKGARISLLAEVLDHVDGVPRTSGRVVIDPSTCAGRPHIRNTRVRVSDNPETHGVRRVLGGDSRRLSLSRRCGPQSGPGVGCGRG